jgi:hypothetical protein
LMERYQQLTAKSTLIAEPEQQKIQKKRKAH